MSAVFGDVVTLTNAVGAEEGLNGQSVLAGSVGASANEFCTPKTLSALGEVFGPCPHKPTMGGSYHAAGLAHYARTHDLRADQPTRQRIQTFAIETGYRPPTIDIPIGAAGQAAIVRVIPTYRLRVGGNTLNEEGNSPANDGGGTVADLRVAVLHREVASATSTMPTGETGHFYAKLYVSQDDSEQGADFDQDVWGTLEYRVDTNLSPATVRIITKAVADSTVIGQLFGFVIKGTTQDGFHAFSGNDGGNYFATVGVDPTGVPGCNNCRALSESGGQRGPQAHIFTVNPANLEDGLKSPLHYATKWGGFNDEDCGATPNQTSECV